MARTPELFTRTHSNIIMRRFCESLRQDVKFTGLVNKRRRGREFVSYEMCDTRERDDGVKIRFESWIYRDVAIIKICFDG